MASRSYFFVFLIRSLKPLLCPGTIPLLTAMLGVCGGAGLRQEPLPLTHVEPVASASSQRISVSLDTLIVRDGPGSWARNADWDEYRLTVRNLTDAPVSLDRIVIVDSFEQPIAATASRKDLVRASREIVRRHDDAGLDVKAGAGSAALLSSGAAVSALGLGTISAAGTGALVSGGAASVGGAAAAASGFLLVGPALITTGIVRGINNARVDEQIERRHTSLPLHIAAAERVSLQLFFPMVPSPKQLVLSYRNGAFAGEMIVDTSSVLKGLHVAPAADRT